MANTQTTLNISFNDAETSKKRTLSIGYIKKGNVIDNNYMGLLNTLGRKIIALTDNTFIESFVTQKTEINAERMINQVDITNTSWIATSDNYTSSYGDWEESLDYDTDSADYNALVATIYANSEDTTGMSSEISFDNNRILGEGFINLNNNPSVQWSAGTTDNVSNTLTSTFGNNTNFYKLVIAAKSDANEITKRLIGDYLKVFYDGCTAADKTKYFPNANNGDYSITIQGTFF